MNIRESLKKYLKKDKVKHGVKASHYLHHKMFHTGIIFIIHRPHETYKGIHIWRRIRRRHSLLSTQDRQHDRSRDIQAEKKAFDQEGYFKVQKNLQCYPEKIYSKRIANKCRAQPVTR